MPAKKPEEKVLEQAPGMREGVPAKFIGQVFSQVKNVAGVQKVTALDKGVACVTVDPTGAGDSLVYYGVYVKLIAAGTTPKTRAKKGGKGK